MQIMSNVDIESANLVLAIANGTVSTEHREQIKDMVGNDVVKLISVLNVFVVNYYKKVRSGNTTIEKAEKTIKAEYKAIGLNEVIPYSCFEQSICFFFERNAFTDFEEKEKVDRIRELYESNRICESTPVKVGVDLLCLKLLVSFDLIPSDLEFSETLLDTVNSYTEEEKANALLPQAMARGF